MLTLGAAQGARDLSGELLSDLVDRVVAADWHGVAYGAVRAKLHHFVAGIALAARELVRCLEHGLRIRCDRERAVSSGRG